MRGLALLMIFVDHIPDDKLNWLTLHNFGFSDAAEVFVLLAGVSAMLAYGRAFERDGAAGGLRRIAVRCGRIYLFQAALLLVTLLVVRTWTNHYHFESHIMAPMLAKPVKGLAEGLTLQALPSYLDILPLYVVLLAAFPLVYWAVRRSPWLALGLSAAVWALAGLDPHLNLPNWLDSNGWYFDPFAWQFLFTIGAVLSVLVMARGGALPYIPWLAWLCAAYLGFCFLQGAPWHDWNLPNLQLFPMAMPDKSRLSWLRILDVLALFYVVMSPPRVRAWAQSVWLRPVEACGRHSLEVFSLSCVLALFGRLIFRTYGVGIGTECLVNGVGFVLLCATGMWLDHGRVAAATTAPRPAMRRYWVPAQRH
jgi:hypothetical protein